MSTRKPSEPVRHLINRIEGVSQVGSGWVGLCPAHDDKDPSLSIGEGDDGRALVNCHAGCSPEAVVAALGLEMSDLFPGNADTSYTRGDFARDKKLPEEFLRSRRIRTRKDKSGKQYVEIPYSTTDVAVDFIRRRKRKKQWWRAGSVPQPYGLDLLSAVGPDEPVLIVEGESDALTCQYHGVPVLGIPGANAWKPEYAKLVEGHPVFVVREPDQAGNTFAAAVTRSLPEAKVVDPPTGIKDLSDLHVDDPTRFHSRLEELMQEAEVSLPPGVRCAADALADPEARRGPRTVVSRLAWQGRVTLLAAREKAGKSTFATAAAAALSSGSEFLGELCHSGKVLWLLLEEHEADFLERVQKFGAQAEDIFYTYRPPDTLEEIETIANRIRPQFIVVDTLPALAQRQVSEAGSSAQWTPVMSTIARIARTTGAAILLLHHSKKSDGRYRDSTAIGAGVDMILEMDIPKNAPRVRDITPKGRWPLPKYSVSYDGMSYELVGEELDVKAQVLAFISKNSRSSMRAIREGVPRRKTEVDGAVRELKAEGKIENAGSSTSHKYVTVSGVPPSHEQRDTLDDNVSHTVPHRGDTRTHSGGEEDEVFEFTIPADVHPRSRTRGQSDAE